MRGGENSGYHYAREADSGSSSPQTCLRSTRVASESMIGGESEAHHSQIEIADLETR